MIVQQGITFFVNMLDNIMIGALGTLPMSAVSIVNQLIFVFNLTLFGGLSGVSIFGAQFWGVKDYDGMRKTLRIKLLFGVAVVAGTCLLLLSKGEFLIGLWLTVISTHRPRLQRSYARVWITLRIIVFQLQHSC
jgi:Na+-driven multidrug efflux pump